MSLSKNRINLAPLAEEPQGNEGDIAIIAGRLKYFYNGQWVQYGGYGFPLGYIGSSPIVINENLNLQRYLNGQKIAIYQFPDFDQALVATANVYPNILKTETEWQAIAASSVGGQCGYFVRDEEEGTIRLPKIIMPIQGLTDLSKLGDLVEAGLPNIEGTVNDTDIIDKPIRTGCFYAVGNNASKEGGGGSSNKTYTGFDASRSNPIYGNSDTVQPEAIQYPYFIQIATGQETEVNITNEIELNNPYTLFDSKYSEAPLYNLSWLLSNGTYYAKSVYVTAYEALLVENNSEITAGTSTQLPSGGTYVKRGLSVKLSTAEDITDYDFVINTTDETFRLPIKTKLASSKFIKGNGIALGLTTGDSNFGMFLNGSLSGAPLVSNTDIYNAPIGTDQFSGSAAKKEVSIGVTTNSSESGIELDSNNLYLYYYVGETVQNANLINAGRIEEKLVDKLDVDCTNASAQTKEFIQGQIVPDFENQISIANTKGGFVYTTPLVGYLVLNRLNSDGSAKCWLYKGENEQGALIITGANGGQFNTGAAIELLLPVNKNEKYFFNTNNVTRWWISFVPYKGEN